ncbi:hypothetical protein B0A48_14551 [Cryoendolithus antarcticus]|uniref:Uncharacterized protein n=1 Tax=Cryoendolithus antarcticus TaxID=1507870 RepID=A0A1V8SLM9_9PEZI|nr:hypothetical protein B0A48_14551 [Cryoendolithus antarcticus]
MSTTTYNVYTVESLGSINHIKLFVETHESGPGTGRTYEVIGTVVKGGGGQKYEEDHAASDPANRLEYVPGTKLKIGTVKESDLERFSEVCRRIPVPEPQLNLNGSRMNPSKPIRRCTELTREAVAALIGSEVVLP